MYCFTYRTVFIVCRECVFSLALEHETSLTSNLKQFSSRVKWVYRGDMTGLNGGKIPLINGQPQERILYLSHTHSLLVQHRSVTTMPLSQVSGCQSLSLSLSLTLTDWRTGRCISEWVKVSGQSVSRTVIVSLLLWLSHAMAQRLVSGHSRPHKNTTCTCTHELQKSFP